MITTVTVRAENPSALTLDGTNSYLLIDSDSRAALCIDPGPDIDAHLAHVERVCAEHAARIAAIAITHGHPDHAPGALTLQHRISVPLYAHVSSAIPHDAGLADGDSLRFGTACVIAIDAPGHTFDHLVFYEPQERALFTGDVILGQGYVVIAPPGGAMRPYQRTLARLADDYADASRIYPGHGEVITAPAERIADYRNHREHREREIIAALADGATTIPEIVARIYEQTPQHLWPAAARQVLAYLLALEDESRVTSQRIPRPLTSEETAILAPNWARIVGSHDAAVVEAELGTNTSQDLRAYHLVLPPA
ncbi:MAG: MBL fold metallo-hydrolase [Vulcanimicrobiaceae bacterium]